MTEFVLPPLPALRAFEAVARRASFKRAAEELFVTPTAVSHQIRQLENYFGRRLLERSPRSVTLTDDGAMLYQAARAGLSVIADAAARIRSETSPKTITLSSTAAFLGHWLTARLGAIQQEMPSLELRLHHSDTVVALEPGVIDAAIRYGKGLYANAVPLCDDAFAPVCSPALGITKPADLRRARLLHVDGASRPQPLPSWQRWCRKAGVRGVETASGQHFPGSLLAVQAAIAGQGVALVSLVLARDALASKLLVAPFDITLPGERYHFVCAQGIQDRPDIVELRNWLVRALAD
jgi:LysR family glycine cleavage system transcriptional activator